MVVTPPVQEALRINTLAMLLFTCLTPFMGLLSDRIALLSQPGRLPGPQAYSGSPGDASMASFTASRMAINAQRSV